MANASEEEIPDPTRDSFPLSTNLPYRGGIIAPPAIAIINNADAVLVWLPNPSSVRGQTAGQTKALAIPKAATNKTDVKPSVIRIKILRTNILCIKYINIWIIY